MNVAGIVLCYHIAVIFILRWIFSYGIMEYFSQVNCSDILNHSENRSPVKRLYSCDQLLKIGHATANNSSGLQRLDPSLYSIINKLNIARKRQRGKRGGKQQPL